MICGFGDRVALPWLKLDYCYSAYFCPLFPPSPESINYAPQLLGATLEGRLTQSTFTLEQPLGQFKNVNLSDPDPIWLVVAHSNGKLSLFAFSL